MFSLLLALLLPCLAAYQCIGLVIRDRGTSTWLLRISLAFGLGIGVASCTHFVWLLCVGPGRGYQVAESALLVAVFLWARRAAERNRPIQEIAPVPRVRPRRLLAGLVVIALSSAFVGQLAFYKQQPHGVDDAYTTWNLLARMLFRSGDDWRMTFSPDVRQSDYPLLVPASTARLWTYLGDEATWPPWLVGSLFTLATIGLLIGSVSRLRSRSQGLLAGLVLLGNVAFLRNGAWQYADVPLAFYFLATLACLAMADVHGRLRTGLVVLAGASAALAAWTKNEGLLFLVVIVAVQVIVSWAKARSQLTRRLCLAMAGAAPVLAVVIVFKLWIAPDNALVTGQGWDATWARFADPERYVLIAGELWSALVKSGKGLLLVLPVLFVLLGPRKKQCPTGAVPAIVAVLGSMLAGYALVYLATPHSLHWHLTSSADRLLLQLWPSGILAFFLSRRTPEELLEAARPTEARRAPGLVEDPTAEPVLV